LISFHFTFAIAQQTVQQREDIKSRKISKITEWRYEYIDGNLSPQGVKWGYKEYDLNGNQIVTGRFSSDGQGYPMYLRIYDKSNRPVKRIWYCKRTQKNPAGEECLLFRNYKLDKYGNVIEENGYNIQGQFVARVTFRRDNHGHPIERKDYIADDSAETKTYHYGYNSKGDAIEVLTFDYKGELISKTATAYQYDKQGRRSESASYDGLGNFVGKSKFKYDKQGNKIEVINYDGSDEPVRVKEYKYEFYQ